MKRFGGLIAALALCLSGAGWAKAPSTSHRPEVRPGSSAAVPAPLTNVPGAFALAISPMPMPRPLTAKPVQEIEPEQEPVILASAGTLVAISIRPTKRPRGLVRRVTQAAVRSQSSTPSSTSTSRHGAICGDSKILGHSISAIPGKLKGCGVPNPVKVYSVDGVTLSTPAKINCTTAKALRKWVSKAVKPSVGRLGGGVKSLKVVAHYSCRTRNNKVGAKISEHGRGNAIDIAAINLKNGVSISVLHGWRNRTQSKILKKIHAQACGTFGTVLGPNADRYHQDHFHFDVAKHRSGAYCR